MWNSGHAFFALYGYPVNVLLIGWRPLLISRVIRVFAATRSLEFWEMDSGAGAPMPPEPLSPESRCPRTCSPNSLLFILQGHLYCLSGVSSCLVTQVRLDGVHIHTTRGVQHTSPAEGLTPEALYCTFFHLVLLLDDFENVMLSMSAL